VSARCLRVAGASACSLSQETNCPTVACPSDTVCVSGACATSCATDADCPGGPCIDVTLGGTTVRGCADARASDAGPSDAGAPPDGATDAGTAGRLTLFAGLRGACALTAAGELYCWGANDGGQLGDGQVTHAGPCTDPDTGMVGDYSPTPVRAMITGATQVAIGGSHACARIAGTSGLGEARCWGYDGAGELGHDVTGDRSATPLAVVDSVGATIHGFVQLAAWGDASAAITTTGLLGWGDQHDATGGVIATGYEPAPLSAMLPSGVTFTQFAVSEVGVGLDSDGHVRTWGWNQKGTLGHGMDDDAIHVDFAVVDGITDAREVDLGFMAACARTDTDVLCWGFPWTALARDGDHSACMNSAGDGSSCPRSVVGLPMRPIDVALTTSRICIAVEDGSVHCTTNASETLAPLTGIPTMRELVGGDRFFCGVTAVGDRVFCWGDDFCGQTGDLSLGLDLPPREVILP
jgi:alpha-tubulin suppressor-like RCC1 family protein